MAEPFLSEIRMFSFVFPPSGWALCNGQLLPINQNQAIFALLGTTYGGNGQTNFALPNFRGRVPIHSGNSFYSLGQVAGAEAVTVTNANMPQHTHTVNAANVTTSRVATPASNFPANSTPNNFYAAAGSLVSMASGAVTNVGGSQPHTNMQPYLVINFCIALQGIFPSQN